MAINAQTLQGSWNEVKGKIREKWGQISDDDLQGVRGNVDQLVGLLQRKTGEARSAITHYLDDMTADGGSLAAGAASMASNAASMAGNAAHAVADYAQSAAGTVRDSSQEAWDAAREYYAQTERLVRSRPLESLTVCFGIGLIAGVVLTVALRSK